MLQVVCSAIAPIRCGVIVDCRLRRRLGGVEKRLIFFCGVARASASTPRSASMRHALGRTLPITLFPSSWSSECPVVVLMIQVGRAGCTLAQYENREIICHHGITQGCMQAKGTAGLFEWAVAECVSIAAARWKASLAGAAASSGELRPGVSVTGQFRGSKERSRRQRLGAGLGE